MSDSRPKTSVKIAATCFLLVLSTLAQAHTSGGAGWLHPLSGLDHLLAMIAVGAWSCQMGGRAVWAVPSAFVCCMALGGLIGFEQVNLPGAEVGVSLSVVVLGLAIAFERRFPVVLASLMVGAFGIFHGYAHGYEMPVMADKRSYASGFLAATASLHLVGAVGAHLLLKLRRGAMVLRALGFVCANCGVYLLIRLGGG